MCLFDSFVLFHRVVCISFQCVVCVLLVFFFKQKTAYEMRISDWSSDVCSSDLVCEQAVDHSALGVVRPIAKALHEVGVLVALVDERLERSLPAQIGRASCRERVCQYV